MVLALLLAMLQFASAQPVASNADYSFTIIEEKALVSLEFVIPNANSETIEIELPSDSRAIEAKINNTPVSFQLADSEAWKTLALQLPQGSADVSVSFITNKPVEQTTKSFFVWDLASPTAADALAVSVTLPDGAVLDKPLSNSSGSVYPKPHAVETDGRKIRFTWRYSNTSAGSIAAILIIYTTPSQQTAQLVFPLAAAAILAAAAYAIFRFRSRIRSPLSHRAAPKETVVQLSPKQKLPEGQAQPLLEQHLLKDELAVVELLRSAPNKTLKQKEILRKTEFSKAKLTRLLRNLEERRLVEKSPEGKTNIIRLIE